MIKLDSSTKKAGFLLVVSLFLMGLIWQVLAANQPPELGEESTRLIKVQNDLHKISMAVECYFVDWNYYPPPAIDEAQNSVIPKALTTPIAYIPSLPQDPYKQKGMGLYDYQLTADSHSWLARSLGPDMVPENYLSFTQQTEASELEISLLNIKESPFTYDPSNGIVSPGDIWASSKGYYSFAVWDMKEELPWAPEKQVPWEEPDYSTKTLEEKILVTCFDMRFLSNAIECYCVDNSQYPPPDIASNGKQVLSHRLTTPIAYIPHLMKDPFSLGGTEYYSYWSIPASSGFILSGYGPDNVSGNKLEPGGTPLKPQEAFQNNKILSSPWTYDPTNGIKSSGDIWWIKGPLRSPKQLDNIQKHFKNSKTP